LCRGMELAIRSLHLVPLHRCFSSPPTSSAEIKVRQFKKKLR
jgi:hypothetical protein